MDNKTKRRLAIAAAAASIAAGFEGTRQIAYYDPRPGNPILTVCTGHTGNDIVKGKRYTLDECKKLLDNDMLAAVSAVERCHPNLPDNVLIAFADAVYNIGPKVACDSTASRYLAQKRYVDACNELSKWDKSNGQKLPGLTKRREVDKEVCMNGNT